MNTFLRCDEFADKMQIGDQQKLLYFYDQYLEELISKLGNKAYQDWLNTLSLEHLAQHQVTLNATPKAVISEILTRLYQINEEDLTNIECWEHQSHIRALETILVEANRARLITLT